MPAKPLAYWKPYPLGKPLEQVGGSVCREVLTRLLLIRKYPTISDCELLTLSPAQCISCYIRQHCEMLTALLVILSAPPDTLPGYLYVGPTKMPYGPDAVSCLSGKNAQ